MMLSRSTILVVLLFLSFATPCRCDDNRPRNPIGMDQYVWFAAIFQVAEEEEFLCSGALISPRHVITADHCLDEALIKNLLVRVGYLCARADNCGRPKRVRTVIEHRRDPSFGDIAILVLSSKVRSSFAPAIPDVASPSYLSRMEGGEMIMVGAGRVGSLDGLARRTETLELKLKHTKFKKCGKAISNKKLRRRVVSKATICSVSDQGKPCQGDSGSAILVEGVDSDGDVIVAIHSYGPDDCSGADGLLLFGHVSVSAVAEFVVDVVCEGDKKEKWCPPANLPSSPLPPPPPSPPPLSVSAEVCAPFISAEVCAPYTSSSCPPTLPPTHVPEGYSLRATLLHDRINSRGIISVAFDATSSRLASANANKVVHVWDPTTGGTPQMTFRLGGICCPDTLAFNPAGTILAVDDDFDVTLLDVQNSNSASNPRKLQGHTNYVVGVAWHPDGSMLASCGDDGTVKLWDVASGNVLHTFEGSGFSFWSVSFDRQGRHLASASIGGTISLWDVSTLSHVRTLQGHTDRVTSVAFSPDGTKLASASWDGMVRVWRANDGSPLGVFFVGLTRVNSVAWSPDGQFVVSGSNDGTLRIWDANKDGGKPVEQMIGRSGIILSVAWSGNGKWIASGSVVWEISID